MTKPQTRGRLLAALRNSRNLTQGELANAIGIKTQGTISNWENDKHEIDPANLIKLANFFGVPASDLGYELPAVLTDEPPAWFVAFQVEQMQALADINDKLDALLNR